MSFIPTGQGHEVFFLPFSAVAVAGDTTIVPADPITPPDGAKKRKIRVFALVFMAKAAVNVTFKSNATAISGVMPFAANTGISSVGAPSAHFLETAAGEPLVVTTSADGIYGWIGYTLDPR